MTVYLRADRIVFRFSGPDATHLLGDVLTAPVDETEGVARWFALLTPQGKIIAEGLIGWAEGAHWVDVHESVAENFHKRMRMYKLRAKLEIEMLNESHRVGWAEAAPENGIVHADARGEELGYRVIAEAGAAADWTEGDAPEAARVGAGIAALGWDFDTEDAFPHDIGMDQLGGVDFKKGCYVGQEVVSRMQHRGTARRRPVIVSGVKAAARGDTLLLSGKSVGAIGTPVGGSAVAIVRLDKVGETDQVTLDDAPVQLALPGWARYGFAVEMTDSEQ
ncbi:CAF17-like 4Fe-4S cluster assembly/insertion protein YgfZ [Pelagibacterium xiamenense]|uniref:CAF17-like 4Fe-4S cluster assembly/insertion protein YgfZ n=1 Tax=Pelagibacterium xiamenense TaxID=2901140 RepID=UPI001E4BD600|nr:folate-binding protein [Pelagibacterium xiamenense]MCD7059300.1 folate-binding protein [Pelagibacterium xiamenense]